MEVVQLVVLSCLLATAQATKPVSAPDTAFDSDAGLAVSGSSGRNLRISQDVCKTVCETSSRVVGKVDLHGKVSTRSCFGEERLNSCCLCMEQGFRLGGSGARGSSTGTPNPAFLHICIPTTPRIMDGKDIDFLNIMLHSLEEQVEEQARKGQGFDGVRFVFTWSWDFWTYVSLFLQFHHHHHRCRRNHHQIILWHCCYLCVLNHQVNLMVYNTRPGQHPVFEKNQEIFAGHDYISFKEIEATWVDPTDFEPDNMNNPKDIPGGEVRRQTFDYINMLSTCAEGGPSSNHAESFVVILEVHVVG